MTRMATMGCHRHGHRHSHGRPTGRGGGTTTSSWLMMMCCVLLLNYNFIIVDAFVSLTFLKQHHHRSILRTVSSSPSSSSSLSLASSLTVSPLLSRHPFLRQGSRNNRYSITTTTTRHSSSTSSTSIHNVEEEDDKRSSSSSSSSLSDAAIWHRRRRREMLSKYGTSIRDLERSSSSQNIGIPLLVLANMGLLCLSIYCGITNNIWMTIGLGLFPGSIFSLWQLQLLHDVLHGSFYTKSKTHIQLFGSSISKQKLQRFTLFWGSLPNIFGYYLYLQFGHLSHHSNVGNSSQASLQQLFNSNQIDFEDGDILFVAHRMKLLGGIGPTFTIPWWSWGNNSNGNSDEKKKKNTTKTKSITMSLSNTAFQQWKLNSTITNSLLFTTSFLFERFMLLINDVIVSITSRNYFFPNKPKQFHDDCTKYARIATLLRFTLYLSCGWQSLLFLYLSETLWSIPPHPACAMFVSNHGSTLRSSSSNNNENNSESSNCWPSSSTYAGAWYSFLTLGTNYHLEHHDFPTIPLNQLYKLHQIAPEYYPQTSMNTNIWKIQQKAFSDPDFYACMNVGVGPDTHL